jgi:hypothetical protein
MSDSAKAKRHSHTLFHYILHTEIWANIERVFGVTVYFVSSPSKIQTQVLQKTGMETSLDQNCEDHCERGIQDLIYQLCCSQSIMFYWLVHKHGMF